MMVHLSEKVHALLTSFAEECFTQSVEIWAYGSRVKGDHHDTSDLDLVVRGPDLTPVDYSDLQDFRNKIQTSQIPILVQVFDWASLPENFHQNILENHAVLWKKS